MGLTRREFIKLCMGTAAGAGLATALGPYVKEACAAYDDGKPQVVWLQGASCTGCSVSLLNSVEPAIGNVLQETISLRYHPNLMAGQGSLCADVMDEVVSTQRGKFILVIEGGVPMKDNGAYCTIVERRHKEMTILEAIRFLSPAAAAVIAAGNCASYGGIPAAAPNPTGVVGVDKVVTSTPVINLSLCPLHPDHFLGTVVHTLLYGIPELDKFGRPKMFYPGPIHDNCPRKPAFDRGYFAEFIGDNGCLALLGCKGFIATSDCYKRQWNNQVNWCIDAGAPCHACSEPMYPDDVAPFYGVYPLTNKARTAYGQVVPNRNTEFPAR